MASHFAAIADTREGHLSAIVVLGLALTDNLVVPALVILSGNARHMEQVGVRSTRHDRAWTNDRF